MGKPTKRAQVKSHMWAGVVDGRVYTTPCSDVYAPWAIALYDSEAEARKFFDQVRRVKLEDLAKQVSR